MANEKWKIMENDKWKMLLPTAFRLLPSAFCLLPFRLLPSAFCLLPFRLLPSAFCLPPSAVCLLLRVGRRSGCAFLIAGVDDVGLVNVKRTSAGYWEFLGYGGNLEVRRPYLHIKPIARQFAARWIIDVAFGNQLIEAGVFTARHRHILRFCLSDRAHPGNRSGLISRGHQD